MFFRRCLLSVSLDCGQCVPVGVQYKFHIGGFPLFKWLLWQFYQGFWQACITPEQHWIFVAVKFVDSMTKFAYVKWLILCIHWLASIFLCLRRRRKRKWFHSDQRTQHIFGLFCPPIFCFIKRALQTRKQKGFTRRPPFRIDNLLEFCEGSSKLQPCSIDDLLTHFSLVNGSFRLALALSFCRTRPGTRTPFLQVLSSA